MDRKDFLKTLAVTGVAGTVSLRGTLSVMAQTAAGPSEPPFDLVAVMGGEPDVMFREGIAALGGMEQFIKPGMKVVVKPNIGWDKVPELSANTNPILVAAIVKACLAAGAKEVTVFDHTCDEWRACYRSSEIEKLATDAGAKVVNGNDESDYREISLPNGKSLKSAKVHRAILDCDAWINVPVLKNHGGAKMTIAMKNLMGIVWDRQFFHRNDLQQCIADMCTLTKPPVLNIVDAYRVMKTNGPRGTNASDVVQPKGLFLSTDIVAIDTAATKFFGQIETMTVEEVGHLAAGESLGLGTTKVDSLKVKRIRI